MLIAVAFIMSLVAFSKNAIYEHIGCWPIYGESIIATGEVGIILSWLAIAISLSKHMKWVTPNNTIMRNLLGYSGGIAASALIVTVVLVTAAALIDLFYVQYMGYIQCQT